MTMSRSILMAGVAAALWAVGTASGAVISNPLSVTVTEARYNGTAAGFNSFLTDDLLQTQYAAGKATITNTSSTGAAYQGGASDDFADATASNAAGGSVAFKDFAAPGRVVFDLDAQNATSGYNLTSIVIFVEKNTTISRVRYDFVLEYSTHSAPTAFNSFLEVKDFTFGSQQAAKITVSDLKGKLNNIDSIRLVNTASDGRNHPFIAEVDIVPEPATMGLLMLGGVAMAWRRRRV